ncbi:J domain-containing protein [Agrobacterium tumefaciens]
MNALVKSFSPEDFRDANWDPYKILGITRRASTKTIRAAYRRLAKERHSDVTGDALEFLLLKEAHDFLMDPVSRAVWDRRQLRVTDMLRKGAVKQLEALFDSVLIQIVESSLPPEHQDVPAMVKKVISEHMDELASARSASRRKLDRLHLMQGKVKKKGKGENLATRVLERRVGEIDALLVKLDDDIALGDVMLAELEAYSSDIDPSDRYFTGGTVQEARAARTSAAWSVFFS